METGETLYFLNNSEKILKEDFTKEEIEQLSKKLTDALRYCHSKNKELNTEIFY